MSNQFPSDPKFAGNPTTWMPGDAAGPPDHPGLGAPGYEPPDRRGLLLTAAMMAGGLLFLGAIGAALGVWLVLSQPVQYEAREDWEAFLAFVVDTSVVPPGEREEIYGQIQRLAAACEARSLSPAEVEAVLSRLEKSAVFVLLDTGSIERDLIARSGLSPAEREQWKQAVRRAAYGVQLGKVSDVEFYDALPQGFFYPTNLTRVLSQGWDGGTTGPEGIDRSAADEDLRTALSRLRLLAENAGIPDEPWSPDVGEEFTAAVDRALAATEP
jgi:hypothetical protein